MSSWKRDWVTGHAGMAGLIEAFRQTGTAAMVIARSGRNVRHTGLTPPANLLSLKRPAAAGGGEGGNQQRPKPQV